MFGLILIAIVTVNRQTIVMKTTENYSLIPNNIVRAQTTLERTASVITAIRWNTL